MKEKKDKHFIQQPTYPGGPKKMTEFIYKNLKYPPEALKLGVEGTVFMEIEIDYQGNVVDTKILQSLPHGCNEEATRVAKLLKFNVGKNRGIKVLFHKKIKISYKIPVKIEKPTQTAQAPVIQYNYISSPKPEKTKEETLKPKPQTMYSYTVKI